MRNYQTSTHSHTIDLTALSLGYSVVDTGAQSSQFRNAIRMLTALCAAPLGTIALLLTMNALIDHDLPEPEVKPPIIIDGIFEIPKDTTPPPEDKLEKPEDIELPPPTPRISGQHETESIPIGPMDPVGNGGTEIRAGLFDSDAPIRLVAIAPEYPHTSLEGFVDVRFDITKAGATENIEIVAYEPSKVFNRSVLRAVAKWRYQPRLVQGEPVETKGVMERVSFKMED